MKKKKTMKISHHTTSRRIFICGGMYCIYSFIKGRFNIIIFVFACRSFAFVYTCESLNNFFFLFYVYESLLYQERAFIAFYWQFLKKKKMIYDTNRTHMTEAIYDEAISEYIWNEKKKIMLCIDDVTVIFLCQFFSFCILPPFHLFSRFVYEHFLNDTNIKVFLNNIYWSFCKFCIRV